MVEETKNELSDRQLEAIVEKFSGAAIDVLKGQVDQKLDNALEEMKNKMTPQKTTVVSATGEPVLTKEQKGEYWKALLCRQAGKRYTPDESLDVDGVITQALTPDADSAGQGVEMIPKEFQAELITEAEKGTFIWPMITVTPTNSRTRQRPRVTDYPSVNTGTDANTNVPETNGDNQLEKVDATPIRVEQIEVHCENMDAYVPFAVDLEEESPIAIMDTIVNLCGRSFREEREKLPLVGRGHTTYKEPMGILSAAADVAEVEYSASDNALDQLLTVVEAVPEQYASGENFAVVYSRSGLLGLAKALTTINYPQPLIEHLPNILQSPHVDPDSEGQFSVGNFGYYEAWVLRQMAILTQVIARQMQMDVTIREAWTGRPLIKDAFRTGVSDAS